MISTKLAWISTVFVLVSAVFCVLNWMSIYRQRRIAAQLDGEWTMRFIEAHANEPGALLHVHKHGRCPEGWREVPAMFTERDGTTVDGCVNGDPARLTAGEWTNVKVDYLAPGESMTPQVGIEVPLVPGEPGHDRTPDNGNSNKS